MFGNPATTKTGLFQFAAPATTTASTGLGGTGLNFGAPAPPASSTGGFTLGATAASTASTGFQLPGLSLGTSAAPTVTAQPSFLGAPAPNPTPAASTNNPGLGGFSLGATASSSASGASGSITSSIQKPKDVQVPPELRSIVDELKKHIKENKDTSDLIATQNMTHIQDLGTNIARNGIDCTRLSAEVKKTKTKAGCLKEESRKDLRQGELVQRRHEAIPNQQYRTFAGTSEIEPILYFHELTNSYEEQVRVYIDQVAQLEAFIVNRMKADTSGNPMHSLPELIERMKKMETAIKSISRKVYENHDKVQDVKERYLRYKKYHEGDPRNPFESEKPIKVKKTPPKKLEGPHPFESPSNSALFAMAGALARASQQPQLGGLNFMSTPAPPPTLGTTSLFGNRTQPAPGFGTTPGVGLFATPPRTTAPAVSSSLFRPFSTPQPAFGNPTSTGGSTPGSRFSNSFSNPSSGTLFGGTATNVGIAKPFGN